MPKKFYLITLTFIMAFILSGCYIPILDKMTTTPFLEKKPEETIDLMLAEMTDLKSVRSHAEISAKIHLDLEKLMEIGSIVEPLTFLTPKGKILGESVDKNNKNLEIIMDGMGKINGINLEELCSVSPNSEVCAETNGLNSQIPPVNPDPFSSILKPGPVDIILNYKIKGASDTFNPDNPKTEADLEISLSMEGTDIKLKGEIKMVDKKLYFKINEIPFPLSIALSQEFSEQWFELDIEEIKKLYKKQGLASDSNLKIFDILTNPQKLNEFTKKLNDLAKKSNLIKIKKRLRDEKIKEIKTYFYDADINKDGIKNFINGYLKIIKDEIDLKEAEEELNKTEIQKFMNDLPNILIVKELKLWIDKKNFYLQKTKFNFGFDFSKIQIGDKKIPTGALAIDFFGTVNYSDFNEPLNISAPEETKSIIEIIEALTPKKKDTIYYDDSLISDLDSDGDGLTDELEIFYGTSSILPDTDGDGYLDGAEVLSNYNPNGDDKMAMNYLECENNEDCATTELPLNNCYVKENCNLFVINTAGAEEQNLWRETNCALTESPELDIQCEWDDREPICMNNQCILSKTQKTGEPEESEQKYSCEEDLDCLQTSYFKNQCCPHCKTEPINMEENFARSLWREKQNCDPLKCSMLTCGQEDPKKIKCVDSFCEFE